MSGWREEAWESVGIAKEKQRIITIIKKLQRQHSYSYAAAYDKLLKKIEVNGYGND